MRFFRLVSLTDPGEEVGVDAADPLRLPALVELAAAAAATAAACCRRLMDS